MVRTYTRVMTEYYCDFCYGNLEHLGFPILHKNKSGKYATYKITVEETSGEEKFILQGQMCEKCYEKLKGIKKINRHIRETYGEQLG